jgi:putative membrane protein insertion efficiency factor
MGTDMNQRLGPTADVWAAAVLIGAVRVYQWTIRPVIGANCRFEPSCSHYAIEALARHGAFGGSVLTARRILRCNPWHEGGEDPVPPAPAAKLFNPPANAKRSTSSHGRTSS